MSYPEKIIVVRGSPEFDVLYDHSELFRTIVENYAENKDEVEISSEFFGGEGDEWHMFVDLFFPEMGISPLFMFKNGSIQVDPKRGTKEQMAQLLRYMMVDNEETLMNFARAQARKQVNAPLNIVPRGTGIRKTQKYVSNNYNNNNGFNNNYYNNNNNNNGPKLGYTENEERYLGKLTSRNAKNYFANEGGKRKTRRNRKNRRTIKL
jgi:hypothetical protein